MNVRRWWDIAMSAAIVVVAVLAWFSQEPPGGVPWGAFVSLLAIYALYVTFGRRLIAPTVISEPDHPIATGIAFQACLAVLVGIASSFGSNMLTIQFVVFPLLWTVSHNYRQAIIANVAAALAVGIGLVVALGGGANHVWLAIAIQTVSVGFSIALGTWITRIADWGAERQGLLDELTAAQGRLDALSRDAGAVAERERIARDIHDTIAQNLTSIVMVAQRTRLENPSMGSSLALIEEAAREALSESRALVAANAALPRIADPAHPEAGTHTATLSGSLQRLAERFTRETGVLVTSSVDLAEGDAEPIPRAIEVVLLRCAQEGLANIRKHADAKTASVKVLREASAVELIIVDDGRGLGGYAIDNEHGFGLTGMRERVALVGGELVVADDAGGGARVTVRIPLQPAEAAEVTA